MNQPNKDYGAVSPSFWTGPTGKEIKKKGPYAQLVALYLMTNPHRNALGLYYLPKILISHETALSPEEALEGLQSLFEVGFCAYDSPSEVIWIYKMAKWQISDGLNVRDNKVIWINKKFKELPNNPFLNQFYEFYKDAFHLQKPSPLKAPLKPDSDSDSDTETDIDIKNNTSEQSPDKQDDTPPPETKKFDENSLPIKLSKYLFKLIQEKDEKAKEPDYQKWAVHIDRLNRIDKREWGDIKKVIDWCQKDGFWYKNILSTGTLRDKFQRLYLAMNGNGGPKGSKGGNNEFSGKQYTGTNPKDIAWLQDEKQSQDL